MQKPDNDAATLVRVPTVRLLRLAVIVAAIPALPVVAQVQKKLADASALTVTRVVVQHAFGDTAQHVVRVLEFDAKSETASVYASAPRNLLVIALVPGREIEVIYPGDMTLGKGDRNTFAFLMHRFELTTAARGNGEISAQERQYFEACQRNRAARMRQNESNARNARATRDSTGTIVAAVRAPVPDLEIQDCEMPTGEIKGNRLARRQLAPRGDAERYLMVVTSSAAVTLADLEERLAGLTAVAPDVGMTIEAIAAGIFAGRSGTYGGTWVAW